MADRWISPDMLYADVTLIFGIDKAFLPSILGLMDKLYPSNEDEYNACGFKQHNVDEGFIARLLNMCHILANSTDLTDDVVDKLTIIFRWEPNQNEV